MHNLQKSESGRNMLEMIAVIILGMLILLGTFWGFKSGFSSAKVGQITEDISTAVTERRYQIAQGGMSQAKRSKRTVGSTEMTIENVTSGADKGSFTILLTSQNKKICEEMKKYVVFSPKRIEIDGFTDKECGETNDIKFYFDGYNRGNGGSHGRNGGNGGHGGNGGNGGNGGGEDDNAGNGDDPLKSKCDGVKCGTCKKCDWRTGACVQENDGLMIGDCGVCKEGKATLNASVNIPDCKECGYDTNWNIGNKSKGILINECQKCDGNGGVDKKTETLDICYQCVDGEKIPRTDTFSCGNTCCEIDHLCLGEEGHQQCSVNKPDDCNECQTFNTTTGKCEGKVDACHYCDTTNNSWKWLEGKTNYTTCGAQCCEFGCDETDNTKCKNLSCTFGSQTFNHNAVVGNCGVCHNGVIESKEAVDVCHTCDATTSWNLNLKDPDKETVCGTQCCEFGCDETDDTKCVCMLGQQLFKHNALVGNCGKCNNGIVEQNVDTPHTMCQFCDNVTWKWVDEIIIPQQGIFARETPCNATQEIARLGPYLCDYDIYVKGHIDDTFLVKKATGETVCNPNNREHHMTDGILYTIPAGQSVVVYAKDVGCSIIAWERDYHGAESRTPQKPTMEIQKATHSAGYCNPNI